MRGIATMLTCYGKEQRSWYIGPNLTNESVRAKVWQQFQFQALDSNERLATYIHTWWI